MVRSLGVVVGVPQMWRYGHIDCRLTLLYRSGICTLLLWLLLHPWPSSPTLKDRFEAASPPCDSPAGWRGIDQVVGGSRWQEDWGQVVAAVMTLTTQDLSAVPTHHYRGYHRSHDGLCSRYTLLHRPPIRNNFSHEGSDTHLSRTEGIVLVL